MADKLSPAENLAKAAELVAPLRDRNLSDTDRALVYLLDAMTAAAPAPAPASAPDGQPT